MICNEDGEDIRQHSESGVCPLGKFGTGGIWPMLAAVPLAGDLAASVTAKFGIDRAAKFLAKLAGKPDCGCAERRKWLNRLDARVRRALGS